MEWYPLLMEPVFRHGEATPWGGQELGRRLGKPIPDDRTGESLEVSALPGLQSTVKNGPLAGRFLGEVFDLWGAELTGREEKEFPLLLKFLDARERLSVQVHPGDAYARAHEGKLGKNEAWLILHAEPGAQLVYGVRTDCGTLEQMVREGRVEEALNWVDARDGAVFHIPAGTVHALGGGILCYEIQESSDVTYRFWDWGRVDREGHSRPLHLQKALEVTRSGTPQKTGCPREEVPGGSRQLLVCSDFFELWHLQVEGEMPLDMAGMKLITPLAPCRICWGRESLPVEAFRSVVVPAALEGVILCGNAPVLMTLRPRETGRQRGQ